MLVSKLYAYAFLGDFILLYPVYSLLFIDTGLSVAETSSLFVIWSVTSLVLEVPSGAWADAVSRRLLLCVGPLLAGAGFALWILFPSYWAFAAGFVLWGAQGALVSGAYEALAYEELERLGEEDRYATIMGRADAAALVATATAMALAVPVLAVGGHLAVGAASVLVCVVSAVVALTLPEHRTSGAAEETRYLAVLRTGVTAARTDPGVLHAVLLLSFVPAIWGALEEYVPFLSLEIGVAQASVPLLVLVVWAGATAGGLLSGVAARLPAAAQGALIAGAALALGAGAVIGHPAGFALIAVAAGALQMAGVAADARLQERITGPARATVTSVAGLGMGVVTLAVYVSYGLASSGLTHGMTFALMVVPYVVIALIAARPPVTAQ
jgi:MFS family permease